MPIKNHITKYDILVNKIHKVAQRYNARHPNDSNQNFENSESDLTEEEIKIKTMAVIIASFSSNHSWQTHKCMQTEELMDKPEVKNEFIQAEESRWKNISLGDIEELASSSIPEHIFYRWLLYNVDNDKRELYKSAWNELESEFDSSYDEIEQNKN